MQRPLLSCVRGLLLASIVAVMAAASAGLVDFGSFMPARILAAPAALRYPPEVFQGRVMAGTIISVAGATQFMIDRPQKIGTTFNPSVREQVTARLEGAPTNQAALVIDNAELYYEGTYDPALAIFFVNQISAQPLTLPVAAPEPAAADNSSSSKSSSDNSSSDNSSDNSSSDNSSSDNGSSDNSSSDNSSVSSSSSDNSSSDNSSSDNSSSDNSSSDNSSSDNS